MQPQKDQSILLNPDILLINSDKIKPLLTQILKKF
jgi:hypothetical protein